MRPLALNRFHLSSFVISVRSRIDFLNATKQDISALAAACHGTQGHLEPEKFSTRLGVVDSGLIDVLSTDLLQGQNVDNNKSLRVKMQGLDICGSFSAFVLYFGAQFPRPWFYRQ